MTDEAHRYAAAALTACAALLPLTAAPARAAAPVRADDGSSVTAFRWLDKARTTFDATVRSAGLGRDAKVRVLVPKGWKQRSAQSWPVVYAYHGGNDTYVSWTRSTDIERVARRWGVMVVMPEGANGSYTNWYNGGKGGRPRWEDFHLLEVRQLAERNWHAGGARAAMGLSSGGQGACTYAGRSPGTFRYAACFSGVLSMSRPGIPMLLMYTNLRSGQRPEAIWGVPGIDQANWDAHDPIKLLPRMRGTGLYVSSGTTGRPGPYDKPGTAPWDVGYVSERAVGATVRDFVAEARRRRIPVTSHLYGPGRHAWPYWQREMHTAWPLMMRALGARPA
ncbi:alpha/beta hydrolase [Actinomadura parmotrematis]|uniref:Esterase family protein n=1 Tax=Actinomadura parmotrematis TaxID=2864039 RepID=A0ABS7FRY3_9ACTN|nr:alpha/beta hydrolase family protein [Actinomadura parmotrematis]MBW8482980.1 esterase family protein [Actinomadura parmotrematis]